VVTYSFALPDDTTLYCAHEYTQSTPFRHPIDPITRSRRASPKSTIPRRRQTDSAETCAKKDTNPFLRAPAQRRGDAAQFRDGKPSPTSANAG
jgi:hydroxyacylglutathione hydrolase